MPNNTKTYNIIVNGRQKTVEGKELTYLEVVQLAFPGETPTETKSFTVTYTRGNNDRPQGSMVAGDTVIVKKDMEFDVTATDKS